MSRIFCGLILVIAAFGPEQAFAITEDQAIVGGALQSMGFTVVPSDVIGGVQEYRVNAPPKAGTSYWVQPDGTITAKKKGGNAGGGEAGATEQQALVGEAMEALGYDFTPAADGQIGGEQEYRATRATTRHLRRHNRFWLLSDGSVSMTKPSDANQDEAAGE